MPRNHSVDKHHLTGRLKCSEVSREKLGHILEYIFVYARIGKIKRTLREKGCAEKYRAIFRRNRREVDLLRGYERPVFVAHLRHHPTGR